MRHFDSSFWIVFAFSLQHFGLAESGAMEVGLTSVCRTGGRGLYYKHSHTGQYDIETLRMMMLVEMM